jgi:hypothetical protein
MCRRLPGGAVQAAVGGQFADAQDGVVGFDNDRDAAYLDNALEGQVTERRKQVARVTLLYDTTRSEALSPGASTKMIAEVAEAWT